jgi:type III pantothenate kinase
VLLAVSVGNSHVTFGAYESRSWVRRWRIQTVHAKTSDEYLVVFRELLEAAEVKVGRIRSAILSSVVPPLTGTMVETITQLCGTAPLILSPKLNTGIRITTENPAEVGADLVANAVAAYERFHGSCIVVDFGTALTFTAVAAPGELRGVAIAPGLSSAMNSLAHDTAQLPRVPLTAPLTAAGRNTTQSIQAGIVLGYTGLVEGLIRRLREELGGTASVVLTGGQSPVLAPLLAGPVAHEQWLTLEGLRIVAARNGAAEA